MCWNSSMDSLEKIEQQEMESTKHNVQYLGDDSKRRKISFYWTGQLKIDQQYSRKSFIIVLDT